MSADIRQFGQHLIGLASPAVPFIVQTAISAGTFTLGLNAAQAAGYVCRVSCATPIVSSVCGMAGVACASIAAGQASVQCNRAFRGLPVGLASLRGTSRQQLLIDAVIGMTFWKVLGGRFRSVMPSDLFAPGALAAMSLPSPGARYAGDASRDKLRQIYKRFGCHHCGSKKGAVIGDHIPPNRQVWGSSTQILPPKLKEVAESFGFRMKAGTAQKRLQNKAAKTPVRRLLRKAKETLAFEKQPPLQRYYPQCVSCSHKQSAAVKQNKRTLVMHLSLPRGTSLAGSMVGLRYYVGQVPPVFPPRADEHRGRWGNNPGSGPSLDAFGLRLPNAVPPIGEQLGSAISQASSFLASKPPSLCSPYSGIMHFVSAIQ